MPFDYQSTTKIRKRFSLGLNPTNTARCASPFGDQLSRQLETQLRLQTHHTQHLNNISRSHSLSCASSSSSSSSPLSSFETNHHPSRRQQSPRRAQSLRHASLPRLPLSHFSPTPTPLSSQTLYQPCSLKTSCSPNLPIKAHLNRHSSTSSSQSNLSTHSNLSRTSSTFYHLPSTPSSVGEFEPLHHHHHHQQFSQLINLKSNSFNLTSHISQTQKTLSRPFTPRPTTSTPSSPIFAPSSPTFSVHSPSPPLKTTPMRILKSLSINLHSSTRSKKTKSDSPFASSLTRAKSLKIYRQTSRHTSGKSPATPPTKQPILPRESLYESLAHIHQPAISAPTHLVHQKSPVSVGDSNQGPSSPMTTQLDPRKVQFNLTPLTNQTHSELVNSTAHGEKLVTKMASIRPAPHRVSVKRSLSMNASLDTIPEENRAKMYLLSRTGMTLEKRAGGRNGDLESVSLVTQFA